MNVTILSIDIKQVPTTKGSYGVADVAYKNNSFQGKIEGKKIMSFGATAGSFKTLSSAVSGDTYEVEIIKNDKGYNDWVSMTKAEAGAASPQAAPAGTGIITKGAASTPVRSTYETPQERAEKQVFIVRQSSISAAINTLSLGAKKLEPDAVMKLAQTYADFVFGVATKGPTGFNDLPNFPENEFPDVN